MKTLELQSIQPDVYIGVSEKKTDDITAFIFKLLSSEMNLYVKTRKFHWNLADGNHIKLHKLFELQYKQLEQAIDKVAEFAGNLSGKNIGIMQEFAKRSNIKEEPGQYSSAKEFLDELLQQHKRIISQLLKNINDCMDIHKDIDTADFLTGLLHEHEEVIWALKRY